MENITHNVAESADAYKRKTHAIDLLIEDAPMNCHLITVEITPEGHNISYFSPSAENLRRFSYKNVHGDWIN